MVAQHSDVSAIHPPSTKSDGPDFKESVPVKATAQQTDTTIDGRVHSISRSKNGCITLLLRRNGQFFNCNLDQDSAAADSFQVAQRLTLESLVRVHSTATPGHDGSQDTSVDNILTIEVERLLLLSAAEGNIPDYRSLHGAPGETQLVVDKGLPLTDERLDNRLLDARVPATAAIFKLFSGVHELAVQFLSANDFHHIPTPALVTYEFPGEEDDHFFLPYFDRTAMLAPTGEVHLGMALAADLERVYDIHTVFRREPKSDGRHLTEFTMLELVFALENDWTEILELADRLLVFLIQSLQQREKYKKLTDAAKRLYPADFQLGLSRDGKLPRLTFREAKGLLRNSLGRNTNDHEDFTREEEAVLGELLSGGNTPLETATDVFIVTNFPKHVRPCNVYASSEDGSTTNSFDVILRGQEIVTGCQLLHSYKEVRSAFTNREPPFDPDSPAWQPYMTAHGIGMPPWGGFGLGLNRLIQGFLGLSDIRETVLYPRDALRLSP